MSLPEAAVYLLATSLKNRVRKQIVRLKQPRYLAATLLGGGYLWLLFVRRGDSTGVMMAAGTAPFEAAFLGMALLSVAGSWIFGGEEGALAFTEAEATLLFSAPVTRAGLMRYKLARTLAMAVFSALLVTVLAGRRLGASPLFFATGAWIGLSTLSLHLTGASLTRATLVRFGLSGLRRRLLTAAALLVALGMIGFWVFATAKPQPPATLSFLDYGAWLVALMESPPLSWVLWPLRAPLRVAFASQLADLWPALPVALALLGAHIAWVLSSDVAFESASLNAAEKRGERMRSRGGGRTLAVRRQPPPFALSGNGRPEVAILWKNLVALTRVVSVRLVVLVVFLVITFVTMGISADNRPQALAFGLTTLAGFTVIFAPQLVSADLRDDLPHLEILRTWPLSGAQLVWGELMAPLLILGLVLWAQLGAATALALLAGGLPVGWVLAVGAAACLVTPLLAAAGLVAQNLAAILFPSWVGQDNQRGVEALGQRLLTTVGRVLVLTLGFLPAALVGGAAGALVAVLAGPAGVVVGAAVAAGVLGLELRLAVRALGRAFERMDLSRE